MKLYYHLNHNPSDYQSILHDVKSYQSNIVTKFEELEWAVTIDEKIFDLMKDGSLIFKIVYGTPKSQYYENIFQGHGLRVEDHAEFWPTFWIHRSESCLESKCENISHELYSVVENFKHKFICLNHRGHYHRACLLDEMVRNNLLNSGIVTWHDTFNESREFNFQYFDGEKLMLEDNFSTILDSYLIPKEFHDSFFHFITEATTTTIFITEKTAIPLLYKKPFAVLGAVNFHKYLQSLGFELYDELIDYSFDSIEDTINRTERYVENIREISKLTDLTSAYKILKPKIDYNYQNCIRLMSNTNLIPNEVLERIELIRSGKDERPMLVPDQMFLDIISRVEQRQKKGT